MHIYPFFDKLNLHFEKTNFNEFKQFKNNKYLLLILEFNINIYPIFKAFDFIELLNLYIG